jgi:hypothetical protein
VSVTFAKTDAGYEFTDAAGDVVRLEEIPDDVGLAYLGGSPDGMVFDQHQAGVIGEALCAFARTGKLPLLATE